MLEAGHLPPELNLQVAISVHMALENLLEKKTRDESHRLANRFTFE